MGKGKERWCGKKEGRRLVVNMLILKCLGHIPKELHRKYAAHQLQSSGDRIRNTDGFRAISVVIKYINRCDLEGCVCRMRRKGD